ncbi:NAD(+)/NADH kinase [Proteiniborus sp. MB09-C3]|uniref:NAD(+)/NADH kinase n=1 Tax=Proteiniborus sp. MB09-C3 TaxID=3050072 RepID=UPI002556490E|nr:NAD(+)/NADH kinase [Proteiniborus sp. MB09-C3]WIV10451.1 NAD(+)/NADH kinase [Proteiniborus sp. MB09-C3]
MENGLQGKKIINIIHNDNIRSKETSELLENKLKQYGYIISSEFDYNAELSICIGGDGAFLRAVHKYNFPYMPFVGVNTGHLGFFHEITPENINKFVENYSKGKYNIEDIYLVEAIVCTRTSCIELIGVNEIVIKGIESKVIHLNVSIDDDHLECFSGDGLIISTPSGSTAYNLSAGGSIVYPTLKTLQLTPLCPINSKAYRSLQNSAIIPDGMAIKINPEYRDENTVLIVVDGNQLKYDNVVEIIIKLSDMTLRKLTFHSQNFWSKVRDRFI